MTLAIFGLLVDDLALVARQGSAHPVFGAFLDFGSFGEVNEVGTGEDGLEALLGGELAAVATEHGLSCLRLPGTEPLRVAAASGLLVVSPQVLPTATEDLLEQWHRWLESGALLSFVLSERSRPAAGASVLWVTCGYRLAAMGFVAPCRRQDLWATWLRIAGAATCPAGRFLLEEPSDDLDPQGAADLTERLRQLYGE